MNCPIPRHDPERLVAYAASALNPEAARALEQHLADCSDCRSMAADQTAVWKALDAWEAPPVSPDFDRRLYRRIDQEGRFSWWERLAGSFHSMPLRHALPLTAAAGLLLVAGLLLQHPGYIAPIALRGEIVRANQVELTLDDLDLLGQFGTADSTDSVHPDVR